MQMNHTLRKGLTVGIILFFVAVDAIPTIAQVEEKIYLTLLKGNTLYVGGSGPGNYSKIQDAINASSDGDTVFVFHGTYHEHLIKISKGITLFGENRYSTLIDGDNMDVPILLISTNANVTIENFVIMNSTQEGIFQEDEYNPMKIDIDTNTITKTHTGIFLHGMDTPERIEKKFRIGFNKITENEIGIYMTQALGWILGNNIYNNSIGIELNKSYQMGPIEGNVITDNTQIGMYLKNIKDLFIGENTFIKNYYGVYLENMSNHNLFFQNNFIKNHIQAFNINSSNSWQGNYWSNWIGRLIPILPFIIFPKVIRGKNGQLPSFDFDWTPPWTPYPWYPF